MGNKERNSYVTNQILSATIKLFIEKAWSSISISEIISEAKVSRNSFYRNFNSREDILKTHLTTLSKEWLPSTLDDNSLSFSDKLKIIFSHFEKNKVFYLRLYEEGLLYLFKDILTEGMNLSPESSAAEAYMKAYVIYMLYGWIEIWLQRGMKESSDKLAEMFKKV